MRISDWSSDVCSSDLVEQASRGALGDRAIAGVGDQRVELDEATVGEHRIRVGQDRLGLQRLSGRLRDLDLVEPGLGLGDAFLLLLMPLEQGLDLRLELCDPRLQLRRWEERRVGHRCVSTVHTRRWPSYLQENNTSDSNHIK